MCYTGCELRRLFSITIEGGKWLWQAWSEVESYSGPQIHPICPCHWRPIKELSKKHHQPEKPNKIHWKVDAFSIKSKAAEKWAYRDVMREILIYKILRILVYEIVIYILKFDKIYLHCKCTTNLNQLGASYTIFFTDTHI